MNPDTDSDDPVAGLVAAAAAGDGRAWAELVDRFSPLVWSVCRAHRLSGEDAADVYQVTWLRLLENLSRIRDPRRLPGWISTTCRREAQALLSRARASVATESERLDWLLGGAAPADEPMLTADQHAALWRSFGQLSDWCQRVLRALILNVEGKRTSYPQVAAELGTRPGSLGPTRGRCLKQLRKLLEAEGI
ncbi:MAG TPA: sigma-70 family RNA polymerase sigma factor [Trebonia sp.]|nr:sigma-70 family RNA polymerase sigma factor [Trebonia sp.]